jgi:hypothetical protein
MSFPFNPHDRSFANLPRRFTGEPRKALQAPRVIAELSSILSGFPQIGSPKGSSSITGNRCKGLRVALSGFPDFSSRGKCVYTCATVAFVSSFDLYGV